MKTNEGGNLLWLTENQEEELFRRRINYTYANYQKEGNILWVADLNFEFDRVEYDAMVKKYQELERKTVSGEVSSSPWDSSDPV